MRVRISVTLPADLLRAIDREVQGRANRSHFIERAVRAFVQAQSRTNGDADDIKIINRRAHRLNAEAADVLEYQV